MKRSILISLFALFALVPVTTPAHADSAAGRVAPRGPTAMADANFQQLVSSVKRASFDKDKGNVIVDAARYNWFTSRQLAHLIGLMSFDSGKVDAAAGAWNKLVDPENSSVIYDKLSFSSSRDQLRKRVR
jgi:hypothetical protein